MISVQEVVARIKSALDAEGSGRYTFDQDFKHAINISVEWLQAVFNKAFSSTKLSEESLSELVTVSLFQTNAYSRWEMNPNDLGHKVWTILSVIAEPIYVPSGASLLPSALPEKSFYRPDLSYIRSRYSAKRMSREEWEENSNNVFSAGNTVLTNAFKSYGYINASSYSSSNYASGDELEIRPAIEKGYVAVTYLRVPKAINSISDTIEFPETMINLVVDKALNFIATKQGDQTTLYSITSNDLSLLVKMMM